MNKVRGLALTSWNVTRLRVLVRLAFCGSTQIPAVVRKPNGSRTCTGATDAPPSNHSPDNGC